MLGRAERLTGERGVGRVWGGTFHAMANRLLRLHGRALGLSPDFTVLDRSDTADLMDLIRGDLGLGQGERRFPRKETLADVYSRTVNAQEKLRAVLERDYPWCVEELEGIREIFEAYTGRKRTANALDYDDLLLFWRALAQTTPEANATFTHVLVDEYQDTNALGELRATSRPGEARSTPLPSPHRCSILERRSRAGAAGRDSPPRASTGGSDTGQSPPRPREVGGRTRVAPRGTAPPRGAPQGTT
jgi:UvrD/REP helicase N-terminal domain